MSQQIVRPRERSANIFVNYRREDSSGHAGRLFDVLSGHFAGRLFMDIDTLEPGADFVEAIEQAVGSCEVLIVVIGREWLTIKNAAGHRRLDDPADFVRLEVESALVRKIRVIPVLVQSTPMPRAEELPPSLASLARRNAIELSDARWAYDVDRLVRAVQDILQEGEAVSLAPAAAPKLQPSAPGAPAGAARVTGSRVWLVYLAVPTLVAAVVLASLQEMRQSRDGNDPSKIQKAALDGGGADPAVGAATSGKSIAKPSSHAPGATGASSAENGAPAAGRAGDEPSTDRPMHRPAPKPSPKIPSAAAHLESKPSKIPEASSPASNSPSPATLQPPRVTITAPSNEEKVGASIQVHGTVLGLGDQRVFLCIRQKNGAIYPRGELFPKADGQWSIQLRSSKEKNFEILVVASASKTAAQVLSDQKSRDDGLPVLPAGASIGSNVVTVRRQGKLSEIFNPKHPDSSQ